MTLETKLEALLFWKGEPMTKKKAQAALECTAEELAAALAALETSLAARGLRVMQVGDEIEMRTSPEASALIEKLTKEELVRDLGKAGLETLSIILYRGPVKRADIDYIRGVNSSFIIRNLLIRGLIERIADGGRGFSYKPTVDLLGHMGLSKIEDLPDYAKVKAEFDAAAEQEEAEAPSPVESVDSAAAPETPATQVDPSEPGTQPDKPEE